MNIGKHADHTSMKNRLDIACPSCQRKIYSASVGWCICDGCNLWVRNPQPSREELRSAYERDFQAGTHDDHSSMYATDSRLAKSYVALIQSTFPNLSWQGLKVLDFGAGEGETSRLLLQIGAEVTAVEPYGSSICGAKGIRAVRNLEELPTGSKFDGIMMVEVVEHLPDPIHTFQKLNTYLKPDGWIFLTTPNTGSLKAWLLGNRWGECLKFGHLFLFSRRGLALALAAGKFARLVPCRGFVRFSKNPLRYLLQYLLQVFQLDGQLRFIAVQTSENLQGAASP